MLRVHFGVHSRSLTQMNILKWLTDNNGLLTTIVGFITIIAIFRSPIVALRAQKKIEGLDSQNERKINIFKTLMATRAEPVSFEHVKALNMIDVEFYGDESITNTWNIYRDHLNSYPQNPTEADQKIWNGQTAEYLADLLFEMSKSLGYSFAKLLLKKGAYAPIAHGVLNAEQAIIRRGFVELLAGDKPLKIELLTKPSTNY
jgi:hypothetical protein